MPLAVILKLFWQGCIKNLGLKKLNPLVFIGFGGLNPGFVKGPDLTGSGIFMGFQLLE